MVAENGPDCLGQPTQSASRQHAASIVPTDPMVKCWLELAIAIQFDAPSERHDGRTNTAKVQQNLWNDACQLATWVSRNNFSDSFKFDERNDLSDSDHPSNRLSAWKCALCQTSNWTGKSKCFRPQN
jgi:hypothetical protein